MHTYCITHWLTGHRRKGTVFVEANSEGEALIKFRLLHYEKVTKVEFCWPTKVQV